MATYEFICTECKKKFDLVMSVAEYGKRKTFRCPDCESSRNVHRRPSDFFALTSKKS
jgi:putative FmdB family regulatory protein